MTVAKPLFLRRLLVALLAALGAVGFAAPAADAALLSWKKQTITYRDKSPYGNSVNQAVAWINAMPSPVQLRRASPGYQPDIMITAINKPWVGWAGVTQVGWYGSRIMESRIQLNKFWYATNSPAPEPLDASERAQVTAHEILHAMGLPHPPNPGCSLMDPSQFVVDICDSAKPPPEGKERCGPQRKDARALANRYGGKIGRFDGFFCDAREIADDEHPAIT